jgi:hypothetical protein
MKTAKKRNKLFSIGMFGVVLALGFIVAGCDEQTGGSLTVKNTTPNRYFIYSVEGRGSNYNRIGPNERNSGWSFDEDGKYQLNYSETDSDFDDGDYTRDYKFFIIGGGEETVVELP